MKMASLANYFGLGEQKHRSLDDVRMNLEVVKHCATVLFLESTLPGVLEDQWQHDRSPSIATRSRNNVMEPNISRTINKRWHQVPTPTMTTRSRSKPKEEEASRKSPTILNRRRVVPYPTGSLGQMT
ncbi:protein NEN4-like [Bidens hawaiensis]|uniref:protein NEN4-like n=1 Tax=Bidens hawaiensis TaxID=980011 RepID=UPI0040490140